MILFFQDLREKADKQSDQIRKLKKMLKVYAKKLKDGDGESCCNSWPLVLRSSLTINDLVMTFELEPSLTLNCYCQLETDGRVVLNQDALKIQLFVDKVPCWSIFISVKIGLWNRFSVQVNIK